MNNTAGLRCTLFVLLAMTSGCSALLPSAPAAPLIYTLDSARTEGPSARARVAPAPTLIVNATRAVPGYDSRRIVYLRVPHQLEHFARSEWVDTPARMLEPLILSALRDGGGFGAVEPAGSGVAADLRLDTEVLRLQQEFGEGQSQVRFTLRVSLSDSATRQVIASRDIEETVVSASEDTYGGVVAANRAVQAALKQLSDYCSKAALGRTHPVR